MQPRFIIRQIDTTPVATECGSTEWATVLVDAYGVNGYMLYAGWYFTKEEAVKAISDHGLEYITYVILETYNKGNQDAR